ncbi:Lrp/AsnC family transcriptional regulator [Sphingomonas aracearum]|uniref:Lrp/AsnC family transcriptional regulator n=1 Tax=Sphingomonas aracearum TaxID=2283317 RepID=A0A369VXY3_9SPHN|nr:Lrp/AsnC family transcriptional regulator [Sphingomonas aracearum]RDE06993.1 Lrp/AsnC family transcriptional regulator [Sphingomonas aracearum]
MAAIAGLDEQDIRILDVLQTEGSLSIAAVAERTGLSQNACWRRIKRLEDEQVITGRVTLVNARKLGLDLIVFMHVKASEHSEDWFQRFAGAVQGLDEVVEFYRMAGEIDYLLKLVVENIAAYDRVYKRLISMVKIVDLSSTFAMEEIKRTTALPLHHHQPSH